MPLIIICGIPCSGKSYVAEKLNAFIETTRRSLIIDDNVATKFLRNEIFEDAQKEKELRGSLKSEVNRHLSKDLVVILDSSNYIKGYRYELYCLSKSFKTTHCVIHCDLLPSDCWSRNESLPADAAYEKHIFDALVMRFEPPDSRNRWDSPLFTIHKDEEIPFEDIMNSLFLRKAPPANLSTQCQPLASTNFLYDLDKTTQDVVKAILNAQKTSVLGSTITIPNSEQKIVLFKTLTAGELTRIRRQFISYTKSHPVYDNSKIANMFVLYVSKSL